MLEFSIITATYDCARWLGGTLDSLFSQRYPAVESIVVDGGSTDGTVEVARSYRRRISRFTSEQDDGIYDALNKGIRMATGDVIGFLHAADVYADDDVLGCVAAAFERHGTDSVYGDLCYVDPDDLDRTIRLWRSGECSRKKLRRGWMPPHPSFFVRREAYERYGFFDTRMRISSDYDLMLRFLLGHGLTTAHVARVLVKMRTGGVSNRGLGNLLTKSREDLRAIRRHGAGGIGTLLLKNASKLRQFLPRPAPTRPQGV